MEDLLSIIGLGSFLGTALGCIAGFGHDFTAFTRKKMLRLATISIGVIISLVVLMLTGVIQ